VRKDAAEPRPGGIRWCSGEGFAATRM